MECQQGLVQVAHLNIGNLTTVDVSMKTMKPCTLPETNMAPESNPLEKEIPIGNHQF